AVVWCGSLAGDDYAVGRDRVGRRMLFSGERCGEGDAVGLIGGEPDHDFLIGRGGKYFAGENSVSHVILDSHDGGVKVEFAAVIGEVLLIGETNSQIAESLVGGQAFRDRDDV